MPEIDDWISRAAAKLSVNEIALHQAFDQSRVASLRCGELDDSVKNWRDAQEQLQEIQRQSRILATALAKAYLGIAILVSPECFKMPR
jgi:hypothetical protein